ncbi:MAG: hypothetical protein ACF8GE_12150 [Phycisphaerales bacterium JB043]
MIFRKTWWLIVLAAIGAFVVGYVAEGWVGCFMFPSTIAVIMYFAYVRLDSEGNERTDIDG